VGIVRVDRRKSDPRFVYYFFKLPSTFAMCQSLGAAQAAQPNVTLTHLRSFQLPFPKLEEQSVIADTLTAYDELMENNRRRVGLLEEAARLLYGSGSSASASPDTNTPSNQRYPGRLGAGADTRSHRNQSDDSVVRRRRTLVGRDGRFANRFDGDSERVKRDGRSGSKFRNGDTLLARITPCLENGKTGFVNFLAEGEVGRGSTEFIVLRSKRVTPEFVYCLARTYHFRENAIKSMIGSSGRQRVQESCFEKFMVWIPSATLLNLFSDFAAPVFQQIKALHLQNQKTPRRARPAAASANERGDCGVIWNSSRATLNVSPQLHQRAKSCARCETMRRGEVSV